MEHGTHQRHEIEKGGGKGCAKEWLHWMKGEMDGIRERKQGGNAYKNKNRAGVEMLEARVGGKGKAVENENVLDGYIGKQKDRKMMGRRERERERVFFLW